MHLPVLHGILLFPWPFLHSRLEFWPYPSLSQQPTCSPHYPMWGNSWFLHTCTYTLYSPPKIERTLGKHPKKHLDTIIQSLGAHFIQNHTRHNCTKRLSILSSTAFPKAWDLFVLSHGITLVWDDFLLKTPHALLVEHLSRLLLFQIYIFFLLQMIIKQICNYPGLLCILSRDRYYLNPGHSGAPFLSRNTTDCSEITLACSLTKSLTLRQHETTCFPKNTHDIFSAC